MVRRIDLGDGVIHEFPDDASDDEIRRALGAGSTPAKPETGPSEKSPGWQSFVGGMGDMGWLGLRDEATAGFKTGFGLWGDYGQELQHQRSMWDKLQQDNPGAFLGGQLTGAVLQAPMLPAANVGNEARMGGQMLNSALTGSTYGALYGAGAGDTPAERWTQAGQGALAGALVGPVAPAVAAGVKAGARGVANVTRLRGAFNPGRAAAERVGAAIGADAGGKIGTAAARERFLQQAAANLAAERAKTGAPLVLADMGGEKTRAMLRSATNTSPEGRQVAEAILNGRYENQSERAVQFLQRLTGASGDTTARQMQLRNAARMANKPAYDRAYAEAPVVWNDSLAELTAAPAVRRAIAGAEKTGANRAAAEGTRQPVSPFIGDGAGGLQMRPGVRPSLQFWDHVKRNLDDQIDTAVRRGANSAARDLQALKDRLVQELDAAAPSYRSAREGAAAAFGARDALEAGQKLVTDQSMATADVARAYAKMSAPERELLREGFVNQLTHELGRSADRRNLTNSIFFSSPNARSRAEIVLGERQARELEAFIRTENVMNMTRAALGNSTTARQLMELGLAGGAGAIASGGNPFDAKGWLAAALVFGARRGMVRIDERQARAVANLLMSDKPGQVQLAAKMVTSNPKLFRALRNAEDAIARIGGASAPSIFRPQQAIADQEDEQRPPR